MKKYIILMLFFYINSYGETISVRSDVWCPFNCEHESSRLGFVVDAAKEIFKNAGHTLDYKTMDWNKAIQSVNNGSIDGLVGASKSEVPHFIFPEVEQGFALHHVWAKTNSKFKFESIESLTKVKVGVVVDYDYGVTLRPLIESKPANFEFTTGDDPVKRNIRKLIAGDFDVIIGERFVTSYAAKIMGLDKKIKSTGYIKPVDLKDHKVYIAFSPKNPKSKMYAKILSDGWKQLRSSGKLSEILSKYGLQDWHKN